ncbi:MAG: hypothetical protein K8W52_18605 [Deltaproteobacteria bacterium]|nr:hypothetical protein [Deltaproteobacteria bacterium]
MWTARALIAIASLGLAAAADARPGRVVRVVRGHNAGRVPRICQVTPSTATGTCFGQPPGVGDAIAVIAPGGNGRVRITSVQAVPDSCQNITRWQITIAGAELLTDPSMTFGYIDVAIDLARTAVVDTGSLTSPGERAGEQVLSALDRTGHGRPDFEVVAYACNALGDPVSMQEEGYCVDYWSMERGSWVKLRHDFVKSCM